MSYWYLYDSKYSDITLLVIIIQMKKILHPTLNKINAKTLQLKQNILAMSITLFWLLWCGTDLTTKLPPEKQKQLIESIDILYKNADWSWWFDMKIVDNDTTYSYGRSSSDDYETVKLFFWKDWLWYTFTKWWNTINIHAKKDWTIIWYNDWSSWEFRNFDDAIGSISYFAQEAQNSKLENITNNILDWWSSQDSQDLVRIENLTNQISQWSWNKEYINEMKQELKILEDKKPQINLRINQIKLYMINNIASIHQLTVALQEFNGSSGLRNLEEDLSRFITKHFSKEEVHTHFKEYINSTPL